MIGLIGKADSRFLEKRKKSGVGPFELDHPHWLGLLGAPAIDRALQGPDEQLLGNQEGDQQAKNKCAPLESHKNQGIHHQPDEDRLPDFHVAHGRHEQVERGTRPSFVDKMKKKLIHAGKAKF
jgi:hypothetical protein